LTVLVSSRSFSSFVKFNEVPLSIIHLVGSFFWLIMGLSLETALTLIFPENPVKISSSLSSAESSKSVVFLIPSILLER